MELTSICGVAFRAFAPCRPHGVFDDGHTDLAPGAQDHKPFTRLSRQRQADSDVFASVNAAARRPLASLDRHLRPSVHLPVARGSVQQSHPRQRQANPDAVYADRCGLCYPRPPLVSLGRPTRSVRSRLASGSIRRSGRGSARPASPAQRAAITECRRDATAAARSPARHRPARRGQASRPSPSRSRAECACGSARRASARAA